MVEEYKKLECCMCNNQMASRASRPRCTNCGSSRFNVITEFAPSKMLRRIENKKIGVETMVDKKESIVDIKDEHIENQKPIKKTASEMTFDEWLESDEL